LAAPFFLDRHLNPSSRNGTVSPDSGARAISNVIVVATAQTSWFLPRVPLTVVLVRNQLFKDGVYLNLHKLVDKSFQINKFVWPSFWHQ